MNGFLLLGRCYSDDVPMFFDANFKTVLDYASTMTSEDIIKAVEDVYDCDTGTTVCMVIVEFRNGLPQRCVQLPYDVANSGYAVEYP